MKKQREAEQRQVVDFRENFGQTALGRIFARGQLGELFDGHESMLVHGVAMVEVRNNQARNVPPLGEHGLQEPGIVHYAERRGGVGKREDAVEGGPQGLRALAISREDLTGFLRAALGFRRQRDAVTRDEFQQAQNDGGIGGQLRGRAEVDALVRNREFRV